MKKQLLKIKAIAILAVGSMSINAQTTSGLQNQTLSPNSFYNGSNGTPSITSVNTFTSGNCIFPNNWNGSFGGYWESGWSYSNMQDSVTSGSTNQYSARTAVGYINSTNYAIGKGGSKLKFNASAQGKQMAGFYVTNSTYAAISMRDGDMFGKKFGGVSGNDPDWFKLKVQKYLGGVLANDSVTFYLADFRFTNIAQDYIVKTWEFVDLTSLGNVDSLVFTLTSSDVGSFGMNTPSYFCLDNFTTLDVVTGINELNTFENSTVIYPNPTSSQLNITSVNQIEKVEVYNQLGSMVYQSTSNFNDVSVLAQGVYLVRITDTKGNAITKRIIKD
jgi:Domain of unknown function (DUF4465)/Secretion system C-terminal sorting domain